MVLGHSCRLRRPTQGRALARTALPLPPRAFSSTSRPATFAWHRPPARRSATAHSRSREGHRARSAVCLRPLLTQATEGPRRHRRHPTARRRSPSSPPPAGRRSSLAEEEAVAWPNAPALAASACQRSPWRSLGRRPGQGAPAIADLRRRRPSGHAGSKFQAQGSADTSTGSFTVRTRPMGQPGNWLHPARLRRSSQAVAGSRRPPQLADAVPGASAAASPLRSPGRSRPCRARRLAGGAGSRHRHPLLCGTTKRDMLPNLRCLPGARRQNDRKSARLPRPPAHHTRPESGAARTPPGASHPDTCARVAPHPPRTVDLPRFPDDLRYLGSRSRGCWILVMLRAGSGWPEVRIRSG